MVALAPVTASAFRFQPRVHPGDCARLLFCIRQVRARLARHVESAHRQRKHARPRWPAPFQQQTAEIRDIAHGAALDEKLPVPTGRMKGKQMQPMMRRNDHARLGLDELAHSHRQQNLSRRSNRRIQIQQPAGGHSLDGVQQIVHRRHFVFRVENDALHIEPLPVHHHDQQDRGREEEISQHGFVRRQHALHRLEAQQGGSAAPAARARAIASKSQTSRLFACKSSNLAASGWFPAS